MSTLEDKFRQAQQDMRNPPFALGRIAKLRLYALLMQATVGDATGPRPGFSDLEGRSRWDAWRAVAGIGKEEAMAEYIAEANRLKTSRAAATT